jgi:hypothetical protein
MRRRALDLLHLTIHRGWIEAWLWATLLAAFLDSRGCPIPGASAFCATLSDIGGYSLTLLPGQSALLFSAAGWSLWPALAGAAGVTVLTHLAVRRWLPQRVSVVAAVSIFLTSLVLTFFVTLVWAAGIGHVPPWQVLWSMMHPDA